ncbi:MAG: DUF3134 family protein [Pseudanabaenaceae cyanobacterium]
MHVNPSLREAPRSKPAPILTGGNPTSILDWLKESGLLIAREEALQDYRDDLEDLQEIVGEDSGFDDEDDDDEAVFEDEVEEE